MYDLMGWMAGGLGLIVIIAYIFSCAIFSAWLASEKGYSAGAWFALGLFFGVLAFLAIGFAPKKKNEELLAKINSLEKQIEPISRHYLKNETQAQERQKEEETNKSNQVDSEKIKNLSSMEDLLNDPEIKEHANLLFKMYGNNAKESYLKEKMIELGLNTPI